MKPSIIVLFGPTGVGKSDLADQLALRMPIEIINGDVGQLYTPLSVGTAKPDLMAVKVPHHLFDYVHEPKNYTVVEYRQAVNTLIKEITARGNTPVIVGGSTLYLSALLFPPQEHLGQQKVQEIKDDVTWEDLACVDPQRAMAIHHNDIYRIKRALMIARSGTLPSERMPMYQPLCAMNVICLVRDTSILYERINLRVEQMMRMGWQAEVGQLLGTPWEEFLMAKKLIGYDDIIRHLRTDTLEYHQLINSIQQKTRRYAKRQMTFWRMLERKVSAAQASERSHCQTMQVTLRMVDLGQHDTGTLFDLVKPPFHTKENGS